MANIHLPTRISKTVGDLSLVLAPESGGAIAALQYRGVNILRALRDDDEPRANLAGCFPLVPYSNRIAFGRFRFDGQSHELARNFGEHPHTIHGNGWLCAWQVESELENAIVLTLQHEARGEQMRHWPWSYQARQVLQLSKDTLCATLSCTNLAAHDMPVGLGFHPYFAQADKALVRFSADKVLINDHRALPVAREAVPAQWDYRELRAPVAGSVDNCFVGWDRRAEIYWPETGIKAEIHSPDADNAVFFVPPIEKNFVAIEPVTNVNNAINDLPIDAGPGAMRRLRPGATMSVAMAIRVSHHAQA
ncbi:aldose 1-epimerase [Variovorax humicola]|uniref:Aldose 1-epimerase n=1 Tax=Variovorax humicola TaxID=1769758 RepID=A0ABU8W3A8_9BURK